MGPANADRIACVEVEGLRPTVFAAVTFAALGRAQGIWGTARLQLTLMYKSAGIRKSGLMGFCDVAPGQRKILAIRFLHGDKPFRCDCTAGALITANSGTSVVLLLLWRPWSRCRPVPSQLNHSLA